MKRLVLWIALLALLVLAAAPVGAAGLPVVKQPNDPSFTAADREALSSACTAIAGLLRVDYSLSRMLQLRGLTWSETTYAQFVAGTLQAAGYSTYTAVGSFGAVGQHTWVLAGVSVPSGMAYVPVEASPSWLNLSSVVGQIAWQNGVAGTSFDQRYAAFTEALASPPNAPPSVSVSVAERYAVVNETTTLLIKGNDPDGELLLFLWSMSDGTEIADPRTTLWYTFREAGDALVTVTAIDTRGASTVVTVEVDVLAVRPDCGCGH